VSFNSHSGTLELAAGLTVGTALAVGAGTVQLDSGSSLTDGSGVSLSGGAITGHGSVNASLSGTGTVTASGGILDLTGTVNSGLTLAIADVLNSVLRIDGTATTGSITLDTANQTLEIGVAGTSLTLTTRETVTGGAIHLGGGTLADSAGFQLNGGTISGTGAITGGTIDGTGIVEALGGQLDLSLATIGGDATGLEVANDGSSTLVVDNAASGAVVSFLGGSGTLRVLHINDFFATIAGLNVGTSGTVATNEVDLADVGTITRSVISGEYDYLLQWRLGGGGAPPLCADRARSVCRLEQRWRDRLRHIPEHGRLLLRRDADPDRERRDAGREPEDRRPAHDPVRRGEADPLDRAARL
jgi:hypothetical protein